ncbi:MAG TPA: SDR family oxidoreductase [Steroidobacteraceae bacterium]
MSRSSWAVVTGASGGIGLELARNLAAEGHPLVLVARGREKLETLAAEVKRDHGVDALVIATDLSEPEAADRIVTRLREANITPQVLVNNAGFGLYGLHAEADLAEEQAMLNLNVTTLTRLTKLLLPGMLAARSGRILNVASTAAFQPGPYMAVYYATKAYVLSYSEALAQELAGTGVSVTALCPGPTASGFQDKAAMRDSALVKDRRLPSAKDVADYAVKAMNRGQRVAIHGAMNWLLAQSIRFTPRRVVTWLVAKMSRPV